MEERNKRLGGSEIATVLGMNPYQTPYQLWEIKTGKAPKFEGNEATRMGNLLEPVVADRFEKETGNRVIKSSAEDRVFRHKEYSFLSGTPDRFYYPVEKDGKRVLECKTTSMKVDLMNIPKMWFIQLMFYLGITCNEKGAVAWLSGNRGFWFDHIDLEFDKELYGLMVQAGVHFWKENVMKDIPPDPQNSEDVQRMYQEHQEGKIADVSDEVYQMHVKLSDIREEIRQLKNIEGEIMEDIKMKYADNEAMRYGGEILSTWKAAKPGCKLDTDKLKKDMPEVYEKYAVERKGSRRFLIK